MFAYYKDKEKMAAYTKKATTIISEVLPDLFHIKKYGDKSYFYFKDENISTSCFDILSVDEEKGLNQNNYISIELKKSIHSNFNYFRLHLAFNDPDYTNPVRERGELSITGNYDLPFESCAKLFLMGINIRIRREAPNSEYVYYDREAIVRKYTIENIINT